MTRHGVKERWTSQADNGTDEEAQEDQFLRQLDVQLAGGTERLDVEHNRDNDHGHEADQMCPDIPSFRVDPEDGPKTFRERRKFGTMSEVQMFVILEVNIFVGNYNFSV